MAAALAAMIRTETATHSRRRAARTKVPEVDTVFLPRKREEQPSAPRARRGGVSTERSGGEQPLDVELDGGLVAAVGEMLRMQRADAAASLSASLAERGVDSNVCAFLEDDLREAADALADAEAFFQETIDALGASSPSPNVLMERAADAGVLERVDYLHLVLSNMRRRLVQVAAGVRHAEQRRRV